MPKVKKKQTVKKSAAKSKTSKKSIPPKKKVVKKKLSKGPPPKKDPYEGCVAFKIGMFGDTEYLGFPRNIKGLIPYPDKLDYQGREINETEVNALFIIDEKGYGYGLWPTMEEFIKALKKNIPKHIGRYRLQQVLLEQAQDMGKFLNGGLTVH